MIIASFEAESDLAVTTQPSTTLAPEASSSAQALTSTVTAEIEMLSAPVTTGSIHTSFDWDPSSKRTSGKAEKQPATRTATKEKAVLTPTSSNSVTGRFQIYQPEAEMAWAAMLSGGRL